MVANTMAQFCARSFLQQMRSYYHPSDARKVCRCDSVGSHRSTNMVELNGLHSGYINLG